MLEKRAFNLMKTESRLHLALPIGLDKQNFEHKIVNFFLTHQF